MKEYTVESHIVKNLKTLSVNADMVVAQLNVTTTTNGKINTYMKEGFIDTDKLENWDGFSDTIFNGYLLVDKEAIDKYKMYGIFDGFYDEYGWGYEDFNKMRDQKPFTSFLNNNIKDKTMVLYSGYDNSFTLADKTVVSKPIRFNYMSGSVHNSTYDLEKLAELIKDRSDVMLYSKEEVKQGPINSEVVIQQIPYYNADQDRDSHIDFSVMLPQEVFNKMLEELGSKQDTYARYAYIKKYDLAGIEAANLEKKVKMKP